MKFKTQIVMKLKNSNCDQTKKKSQLLCNSKTQIVIKLKKIYFYVTQKLKL